jgi:hypothetical protein
MKSVAAHMPTTTSWTINPTIALASMFAYTLSDVPLLAGIFCKKRAIEGADR